MSNVREIRIKPIHVVLDKPRTIVFDLNSFAELEDQFGSVQAVLDQMSSGSVKALRLLLWAGLMHEDPNLTPKDAGKLIQFGDVAVLTDIINAALDAAQPKDQQDLATLNPTLPKGAEPLKSTMQPMTDGIGDSSSTPVQSS